MEQPIPESPLVTLFRHNQWANLALIDACLTLDPALLGETATGTYGTIYETLHHIARAEQWYLSLLTGRQPETRLRRGDQASLAVIREQAAICGAEMIAVAANASPEDIVYMDDDTDENLVWPTPAVIILTQVINHATEHRSQVMTLLTQVGLEPQELSGWTFMDATIKVTPIPRPKPAE
jgi:uncharacterized damage-inducible protein DinB